MADYIIDRWLPGAVRTACDELGFEYESFSEDWILRLSHEDARRFVFGYSFSLNSGSSAQIANDKVACYQILSNAGISAMSHYLVRPEILNESYISSLEDTLSGNDIVLKPLSGTGGLGISRHHSVREVLETINDNERPDWCLAPFTEIKREERIFMLDGEPLLSYEKVEPPTIGGVQFYNLGRGARAVITKPSADNLSLADRSMSALGLRVAAVDIVTLTDGSRQVVEVNSGIMLERFMRQSEANKTIGYSIYRTLVEAMMK